MARVAVLMAQGYEEGETLTIVDILRRAGIEVHTFSFEDGFVRGMHGMMIKADKVFSDEIKTYDVVVLPGGRPGGENLRNNPKVIALIQQFNQDNKLIAAMCSGTTVLAEAHVITGKKVTGYRGYDQKLTDGIFLQDVTVYDQNILTSQGPATVYPFAYRLVEILGKDTTVLKERMLYNFSKGK